jgi:hypothetical protein
MCEARMKEEQEMDLRISFWGSTRTMESRQLNIVEETGSKKVKHMS